MLRDSVTMLALAVVVAACAAGADDTADGDMDGGTMALGPVDGHDLPGVDTARVGVGDVAPDFTLASLRSGPTTLSSFRGAKNVVLVFYRGHW